jgi:geranylgeranyl pyrophosphate synthase
MMMRKFGNEGDVERAHEFILRSDGIERTKLLAEEHATAAIRHAEKLHHEPSVALLCDVARKVVSRDT